MKPTYRLIVSCPDRVGIVAAVSRFIAEHGGWIIEASQRADPVSKWFFMRYEILAESLPFGLDELQDKFTPIAHNMDMRWRITDATVRRPVVLMASRQPHCLVDLLHRWHSGEMHIDISGVISNHEDLREHVRWYGLPYYYVPIPKKDKAAAFGAIEEVLGKLQPELIVMARFMQILPTSLCRQYESNIINIHHSFLPSFVGAQPYKQAYERGVKLIGATCHYVTEELDAGPIIEQDVLRVRHDDTIEDFVRLGRDVERTVLARGLRYHIEDRVLIHGDKTIVFD